MNDPIDRAQAPVIVARADHPISRSEIDPAALKVLYRLKEAGYQGFLVGGCVRDILIGMHPKDFDVATDASPEEVRRLFRNSRLIGRRFRLAHVRFGRQIIEVATFRAAHLEDGPDDEGSIEEGEGEAEIESEQEDVEDFDDSEDEAQDPGARVHDEGGRLLRDNLYGSIEDDVWRRDFTCNALYYNIEDFSVWDYTGGVEDVKSRTLRLIGDPEARYREDPVRMLRAARFEAKLGFRMHEATREPIARLANLLDAIPPARLLDEFLKMFLAGFGVATWDRLVHHGMVEHLFPATAAHLAAEPNGVAARLIRAGLENTDKRVAEDRPVTPMFLFAVLLFGPVSAVAQRRFESGAMAHHAIADATDEVLAEQVRRISIPKRYSIPLREMLALQPRFHRRDGRRALGLLGHPRFRAAYDFLVLRAEAGGEDPELARWWTEIQELPPEAQQERVGATSAEPSSEDGERRPRRRRRGGRSRRRRAPPAEG